MKQLLPTLEHRAQSVISSRAFVVRLTHSGIVALLLIAASLFAGMLGYHLLERVSWIDAFLNAAMLLGGMGPVTLPATFAGKLFAGLYALYCGLVVLLVAGIVLAPVAHRVLHKFHMDGHATSHDKR